MNLNQIKSLILATACVITGHVCANGQSSGAGKDWAQHERYASANKALARTPDVVFMGNSITDSWYTLRPGFFNSNNFVGRGISGQVTSQMLCRFKADVIDLHPRAVVISGGVNDIVGNNGYIDIAYIVDNVASMVDMARANGIVPIVATCLPTNYASWKPNFKNLGDLVKTYNEALRAMCDGKGVAMVDYYTPMADSDGGILKEYSDDRLHPNVHGYETVMEPAVLEVLRRELR